MVFEIGGDASADGVRKPLPTRGCSTRTFGWFAAFVVPGIALSGGDTCIGTTFACPRALAYSTRSCIYSRIGIICFFRRRSLSPLLWLLFARPCLSIAREPPVRENDALATHAHRRRQISRVESAGCTSAKRARLVQSIDCVSSWWSI